MTNLSWIFYQEIPVTYDVQELLINGEVAERAFRTVRDVAIFTNKRLIVKDVQGLTGSKVEIYSLPYSSVHMWSTENAGMLDFTSEVELWTRAGNIKIQLKRDINIRSFERLLAEYIL
ncbi:PH domain-containing protein [uncultured Granulicatella sp.]|uniref:PH domain-containing protein n=1 Tax=uncultured Granulicatella sp. TaxID=316089 RepID=UPI0028EAE7B4|nr:PH domain-containing protein [uncultured Granulicatella sp.]